MYVLVMGNKQQRQQQEVMPKQNERETIGSEGREERKWRCVIFHIVEKKEKEN